MSDGFVCQSCQTSNHVICLENRTVTTAQSRSPGQFMWTPKPWSQTTHAASTSIQHCFQPSFCHLGRPPGRCVRPSSSRRVGPRSRDCLFAEGKKIARLFAGVLGHHHLYVNARHWHSHGFESGNTVPAFRHPFLTARTVATYPCLVGGSRMLV